MSALRSLAKSSVVLLSGRECRPRTIFRGLAAGYKICASPATDLSYLVGTAEPHLQQIIKRYVGPGDVVYDIGANIGYVSLSLAKRVGATGQVIAFEPIPQNFEKLQQIVQINDLHNIRIYDLAASDKAGEAVIRIADNSSTASLVWHKNNASATTLVIKTAAIDDLAQSGELAPPKFVKIDVEGAEGFVIRGMQHTLARSKPVLFIESSEAGREVVWQILRSLNYRCQSAITRQWIDSFDQYRHADFLWLPEAARSA